MRFVPAVVVALLLGLGLAVACEAASDLSQDVERLERLRENVDVDADRIEYAEGERKIVATGKVRIGLGPALAVRRRGLVDLDDQILVASGGVILMEGMNRLEGDRIEYNYRTNLGVITNGRGFLDTGVSFSGVEIRREGERQYFVRDGRFTGCRACQPESETPDWEFRTGEATVYQDELITSRDTSFWVKGIPAFYSPVAALAIGPRRTGFLDSACRVRKPATASPSGSLSSGRFPDRRTPPSRRSTAPSEGSKSTGSTGTSWESAPGAS